MLSLLFTFTFLTVFIHHIHSGPIGTYLHVSAGLIFLDSFLAFFLSMILQLAVVAVFAILVHVIAWSEPVHNLQWSGSVIALVAVPWSCTK